MPKTKAVDVVELGRLPAYESWPLFRCAVVSRGLMEAPTKAASCLGSGLS